MRKARDMKEIVRLFDQAVCEDIRSEVDMKRIARLHGCEKRLCY